MQQRSKASCSLNYLRKFVIIPRMFKENYVSVPVEVLEIKVSRKTTTYYMASDLPRGASVTRLARSFFHSEQPDDLLVFPIMDRHPGNMIHEPRIKLAWRASWNNSAPTLPAFPKPHPAIVVFSKN